jgi:hypothetical protein
MPKFNARTSTLLLLILAAAASRLLPHPPNFAPITALALFGGACFADRRLAFAVPLVALALSDLALGIFWSWSFVDRNAHLEVQYLCFVAIIGLGFLLQDRRSVSSVAAVTLASSVLFFVVTNFAVWALQALYPKTLQGLIACYVAAIPFFRTSVLADLFFAGVLFGGMHWLETRFTYLRRGATPKAI